MPRLHIKSGPRAGERIEVDRELVIGRAGVDLVIDDAELSRRHLTVRPVPGALEVEDLGSTNGTFVEGSRIESRTRLVDGATVKLGTTVLEVEDVMPLQRTRVSGPLADVQSTRVRQVPSAATPDSASRSADLAAAAAAASPPAAAARPPAAPSAPASDAASGAGPARQPAPPATLGSFAPPSSRRGRGLASRSWLPVALSFGTVIVTAAALVVYFAAR